ncbi:caspase domain-containing protein [Daedaleopsis nitida]|nr:caspase domain-containing protein [Daedaleopsis nitida]
MMWDLSGGAANGQGEPPYYAQQSRGISSAPSFPSPPAGFAHSAAPTPFMPIGAPTDRTSSYNPSHFEDTGPWLAPGHGPGPSSAPIPRGPIAARPVHVDVHYSSHRRHSHSQSHSHVHVHSHSHSPRPSGHHSSTPHKVSKPHRPIPDPIQHLQPVASSGRYPDFQYSKCTGRKKALCIGINYKGQPNELFGCVNDARNVRNFLRRRGYSKDDIVMLTDDATDARSRPTRANILDAMHWLVKGAQPNDSLVFHYSGHGGQVKDRNGDEMDGYDEVIFPLDYKRAGYIVDDLMHSIMVKSLPRGCRLTALFDSCHSGSVLDLPYLYSSDGRVKGSQVKEKWVTSKATPADVISWSGCKDSQTSADTWEAGSATGAMSYAFMSSLHNNPDQTYQELLRAIRVILKKKYSQKPQLSSSHRIDTTLKFII